MAIAPTGAIYKSLVFDGESSRDYGIYITGQAVYNAPERDVEMINIPGRNGSFALDKGRFQNIEVTYPAGIFADTETDFAQGISDFRNFLCSRNGYVRLTDEYNPNEYRMAVYKSGLDVSPAQLKAGEFNITFDCKPQRYLLSGEEAIDVTSGDTITNPTLFESSPMLEAEGYGVIGINGSSIELEASELGRIVLGSQYAFRLGFSSLNTQVTEYINFSAESEQNLVAGDAIYLENILLSNWAILRNGSSVSSKTIEFKRSDSDTIEYSVFSEPNGTSNYYLYCRVPSISFEYGTQDTKTIYPRFNVTFVSGGGQSTWTSVFGFEFRYDGARTFRIGAVLVANASSGPYYDRGRTDVAIDYINGDSTKIVPYAPAYIDCDIGEAYIIQNDMVISINNATTMPAELPRLVVGDTEITFDNTITDLKVIPRWWRI